MIDTVIVNAKIVTPRDIVFGAIAIDGGRIELIGPEWQMPKSREVIDAKERFVIPGIVDPKKERAKLNKQREQLAERITLAQKKLANKNFVERAKPQVVARERENLKVYQNQLLAVDQQIEQID